MELSSPKKLNKTFLYSEEMFFIFLMKLPYEKPLSNLYYLLAAEAYNF